MNSRGHPDVDDRERPTRVEAGAIVPEGPVLALDEGAELRIQARPAP